MERRPQQKALSQAAITTLHRVPFDELRENLHYFMYYEDLGSDYLVKIVSKGNGVVRAKFEFIRPHRAAGSEQVEPWAEHSGGTMTIYARDVTFYSPPAAGGGRRRTYRKRTRRVRR